MCPDAQLYRLVRGKIRLNLHRALYRRDGRRIGNHPSVAHPLQDLTAVALGYRLEIGRPQAADRFDGHARIRIHDP